MGNTSDSEMLAAFWEFLREGKSLHSLWHRVSNYNFWMQPWISWFVQHVIQQRPGNDEFIWFRHRWGWPASTKPRTTYVSLVVPRFLWKISPTCRFLSFLRSAKMNRIQQRMAGGFESPFQTSSSASPTSRLPSRSFLSLCSNLRPPCKASASQGSSSKQSILHSQGCRHWILGWFLPD